jgi:predicted RND superfamily exporter protein
MDWERLADLQNRHPARITAAAFLLGLLALPFIADLGMRGDLTALLPDNQPAVVDKNAIEGRFGGKTTLTVVFHSDDPESIDALKAAAEALARRLEADGDPAISSVDWNVREMVDFVEEHRHLYAPYDDLVEIRDALNERLQWERARANPFFVDLEGEPPADIGELSEELEERAEEERARRVRDPDGFFLHPTLPLICVFIRTSLGTGGAVDGEELLAHVKEHVAALEDEGMLEGIQTDYGGDLMDIVEEVRALVSEVALAVGVTIVLVLLAVYVFFREARSILLLGLSLLPPVLVTFGFAEVLVGFLNTSTAFLGSIVIGNGINPNVIWLARYFEARRDGHDVRAALGISHRGTWAATLTASAAAGLAYGSLIITDFRGFRDFGIIGAIGMLLCWVGALTLLPALAVWSERLRPLKLDGRKKDNVYGLVFAWLTLRAPRAIVAVAALISVAAAVLVWRFVAADPLEYDFRELQSERDPDSRTVWVNLRQGEVVSQAATGSSIAVIFPDRALTPYMIEAIDEVRQRREGVLGPTRGIEDLLPERQGDKIALLDEIRSAMLELREHADDEARAQIDSHLPPADPEPVVVEDLPEQATRMFREVDGRLGRILFVEHYHGMNSWDGQYLKRWTSAMRELRLPDGTRPPLSGHAPVFADLLSAIMDDGPKAVGAAFAVTVLLVLVAFRRMRERLLTLGSLLAGILWMAGAMALLSIKLNFLNFVAFPITFGNGVDYSVNYMQRYVHEIREGRDASSAINQAIRATGGAVVLCSLTTIIGYISLYVSSNRALNSFGAAMAISEITCVAAAVVALPALMRLLSK